MTRQSTITVQDAGWAAIQDLGRNGYYSVGVSVGGSSDQYSARCANALVDNEPGGPLIEVTAQHLAFTCDCDCLLAVTGAPCEVTVAGVTAPRWRPVAVPSGALVTVGAITDGLRVYVALGGRLDAETVLGSVAPDRGLGVGTWLARGDQLTFSPSAAGQPRLDPDLPLMLPAVEVPRFGSPWTIDIIEGPDGAEFSEAMHRLTAERYVVTPQSDTVGLRLEGETPARTGPEPEEILSHGVAIGSVELPGPGQLVVLMRGRILTAGYPVLAVATRVAQSTLGQVRPGDTVCFRARSLAEAVAEARRQAGALAATSRAVRTILGRADPSG